MSNGNSVAVGQDIELQSDEALSEITPEEEQREIELGRDIVPPKKRDPHIDVMRGLTMVMVIVTHMQLVDIIGYSIIGYMVTIVIPLFFFTTGYLHSTSSEATMGFGKYFWRKFTTLLVPYIIFFALNFLWSETIYTYSLGQPLFGFAFEWQTLLQAFLFSGQYLNDVAVVPVPIWFLHALFLASLFFFFIMKLKKVWLLAIVALILSLIALPVQNALGDSPFWIVKMMPIVLCFMILGHLFWRFLNQEKRDDPEKIVDISKPEGNQERSLVFGAFASMVLIVVSVLIYLYGGGNVWSITSYWYFFAALVGIIAVFLFSRSTNNLLLQFIGKRTLLYLGLHPMILRFAFIENLPKDFQTAGIDGVLAFICSFIVAFVLITLLVLIAEAVQKPWRKWNRKRKAKKALKRDEKEVQKKELKAAKEAQKSEKRKGKAKGGKKEEQVLSTAELSSAEESPGNAMQFGAVEEQQEYIGEGQKITIAESSTGEEASVIEQSEEDPSFRSKRQPTVVPPPEGFVLPSIESGTRVEYDPYNPLGDGGKK